jgi:hypothetical protein
VLSTVAKCLGFAVLSFKFNHLTRHSLGLGNRSKLSECAQWFI